MQDFFPLETPSDLFSYTTSEARFAVPRLHLTLETAYSLSSPRDETEESPEKQFGHIHLLPAGDTSKPEYWNIVWSPFWHELFTVFNSFATQKIKEPVYRTYLDLFLEIKARLADLQPAPDYMILDFPSGASEMSTTLVNAWVDTIVYALAFNGENISYLRKTLAKIRKAGDERERMIPSAGTMDVKVVLSRVPSSFDFRDVGLERALEESHYTQGKQIIHSDRDLEMVEQIRCGYQTTPQNRRLTHDYLRLFERLVAPADLPAEGLPRALGLPAHYEEKDRVFTHETQRGTLINPNDDSRNVSLKVATFQNLLLGFERGLAELMTDELSHNDGGGKARNVTERQKNWLRGMLLSAGRQCGEAFGDALLEKLGAEKVGVHARIKMWTEFDSDVGFGRFVFYDDEGYEEIRRGGKLHVKCDIYLLESFLTPANDTGLSLAQNHPLCDLMTGYIEGLFSTVIDEEVDVHHEHCAVNELPKRLRDELGELCKVPRSESCLFQVQTRDTSEMVNTSLSRALRKSTEGHVPVDSDSAGSLTETFQP